MFKIIAKRCSWVEVTFDKIDTVKSTISLDSTSWLLTNINQELSSKWVMNRPLTLKWRLMPRNGIMFADLNNCWAASIVFFTFFVWRRGGLEESTRSENDMCECSKKKLAISFSSGWWSKSNVSSDVVGLNKSNTDTVVPDEDLFPTHSTLHQIPFWYSLL